ncbi:penicillin acylase family protein [Maricurvus nonylphenolicus]|uniref:penicillin acylase family protein n=1 Tax=Maricurvus nonylphenolicus TaxID=1008307 RepID=UPI0036F200DA
MKRLSQCASVFLLTICFAHDYIAAESSSTSKTYQLEKLSAPVSLTIDPYGLTHIEAGNQHDLFFAQGFNAARDRLWQIDYWRRSGLGQLAEVLGEDYIARDRAARLFLYRGSMPEEWLAYGKQAQAITAAFAHGINAYIDQIKKGNAPLPPEFKDLDYFPSYWQAEDIIRIRSHGVWQNVISEVERSFMLCSGNQKNDAIRIKLQPDHDIKVPDGTNVCQLPEQVLDNYLLATYPASFDNRKGGSNNWAISGERTASGHPIVAGDPHRAFTIPSLRYAVHLKAPGINVIGAGEPHAPGIATGHNGHVAFAFTIFPIDQEDLLVYQRNPKNPTEYRYKGGWESISTHTATIKVRDKNPVEVSFSYTRHGPVIYENTNHFYALQTAATQTGTAPYLGQLSLLSAKNVKEYDNALQHWGSPGEHHVFADIHGDIAWRSAAKAPIRSNYDGLLPVSGDGRAEWLGFRSLDELPGGINPSEGWIATANNIVNPESYPYTTMGLSYEWISDLRVRRINEVIGASTKHSINDSLKLQNDYISIFARDIVALLKDIDPATEKGKKAKQLLEDWDYNFSSDSAPAMLFQVWYYGYIATLLTDDIGGEISRDIVVVPDDRTVLEALNAPQTWLKDYNTVAKRDAMLESSLAQAYGDVSMLFLFQSTDDWAWGEALQSHWQHLASPLLSRRLRKQFELQPIARGGDISTPGLAFFDEDFNLLYGASWRVVMDVGQWDNSRFINSPGQSGDPNSPYYSNLYNAWGENRAFPLLYSEQALQAVETSIIRLTPATTTQ